MISSSVSSKFWLIGEPLKKLEGNDLPTNGDVIRRFVFSHHIKKDTVPYSVAVTSTELVNVWSTFNIPLKELKNIKRQIKSLFVEWKKLKKNKGRVKL